MSCIKKILSSQTVIIVSILSFLFILLYACEKLEPKRQVKVKTFTITDVDYTSCAAHGSIIDIGENGITQHGFCWSTSQNPTLADNINELGPRSSPGEYSEILTELSPNTAYYVKAFALSHDEVFYGEERPFVTLALREPTVITESITSITQTSAQGGGNVTDNGGAEIIARGVCWSTSVNPTTADFSTSNGTGTGIFTSNLTGLTPSTTYYVRAYAVNSAGTAYGNEVSFTTQAIQLPTLTTTAITSITLTSAVSGGNVTDDGGGFVTARGVCWSTSTNPTTADNNTSNGIGTGSYASNITGLTPVTTYYVRAYATNIVGTAYGNESSFNTPLIDYDGNLYEIVQIGDQVWMAENLKTTHYANGTPIEDVKVYDDNENYVGTYGRLYTWYSVSDSRNICPSNWHVPTDTEWTILTDYLGGESVAGGKLKEVGTEHWRFPNIGATNSSGFTALPGGSYEQGFGSYAPLHDGANFWTSTEEDVTFAYARSIFYGNYSVRRWAPIKTGHFSVRCIKD